MKNQKERWIAHNQNCMPKRLKPETLVLAYVHYKYLPLVEAKYLRWMRIGQNDIIAYQVVEGG